MKLIKELNEDVNYITEEKDGKKVLFIEGPFLVSERKNKNGRLYEFNTMKKEVHRYTEEYINKNRAFGELGHPECFHKNTEALTETGWKKISDISIGENVYSVDLKTNKIKLVPVLKTTNEPYKGKMYHIHNRGIDTVVTPNHRFLLKDINNNYKYNSAKEIYEYINNGVGELNHHNLPKITKQEKNKLKPPSIKMDIFEENT